MEKKRSLIIEKIKKLLSLAGSENPNEAALAASRAKFLIHKHQIEEMEIKGKFKAKVSFRLTHLDNKDPSIWLKELHRGLAEFLDGAALINPHSGDFIYAGEEADFEIYDYLFKFIQGEIRRKSYIWQQKRVELSQKNLANEKLSFSYGVVKNVLGRLMELKEEQYSKMDVSNEKMSKEIILSKRDAIEDFLKEVKPKEKALESTMVSYEFYARGFSEGNGIILKKGIKNNGEEAA